MESLNHAVSFRVVGCSVVDCGAQQLSRDVHNYDVKAVPPLKVMYSEMTNMAIHPESRAAEQKAEVAPGIGTASGHLVELSMMVKR